MPGRVFRVTGTNLSLNQRVEFRGSLSSLTNTTASGRLRSATSGQAGISQGAPGAQVSPPPFNGRISGTVVIGRGKPVDVDAVPAP